LQINICFVTFTVVHAFLIIVQILFGFEKYVLVALLQTVLFSHIKVAVSEIVNITLLHYSNLWLRFKTAPTPFIIHYANVKNEPSIAELTVSCWFWWR